MTKKYAQILNGKVLNVIVAAPDVFDYYILHDDDAKRFDAIVELAPGAQIGWLYENGEFSEPLPPAIVETPFEYPAETPIVPPIQDDGGET